MNREFDMNKSAFFFIVTAFLLIPFWAEDIHEAAQKGDVEKVRELLRQNPALVDARDEFERTPLHWAVLGVHFEVVQLLADKGADVNAKDNARITPLHIAAFNGHLEIARLLLNRGADINAKNKISWTALSFAEFADRNEMIERLIEMGAERRSPHLTDLSGDYFGQKRPGLKAEIFGDGILRPIMSLQSTPSFAPDGKEVYWSTFFGPPFRLLVMYMKKENDRWTTPQIAPFSSSEHLSFNPVFSPDGKKLYFISNRPLDENGKPQGFNNWFVERQASGLSDPKHHGPAVNSNDDWGASVTKEGTLYFASGRDGSMGATDIFRSRLVNGRYSEPENLGVSVITKARELYPFVAPDESFLLLASNRSAGEYGGLDQYFDIYISFRRPDGSWTNATKMDDGINSDTLENTPIVSPDGKYLFYVSQRNNAAGDVYWVGAGIVDELKPDELKREKNSSRFENSVVCVHYLGHASFVLEFDNGVTVLTDYGKSRSYGLDSPIYGLGELNPDILTYSHLHEDHAGGKVPDDIAHVLKKGESLHLKGIDITPIPTFERSLEQPDNFSYLFTYKGIKILHMGDCQGLILGMKGEEIKARIKQMYPDVYDLVLLPIGYVTDIVQQAAEFAALLRTKMLIPIHYWSEEEKARFLSLMRDLTTEAGAPYKIVNAGGAQLRISDSLKDDPAIKIIDLNAAPCVPITKLKK